MKIEVLKTLKGAKLVRRGTVFDSTVAPIPNNILKELSNGADTVKQIGAVIATEKPIVAVEPEIETEELVPDTILQNISDARDEIEKRAPEKMTPLDKLERLIDHYSSMRKVAKVLGTSPQSVSKWRKGEYKPSKVFTAKIHRAFKGLS